MNTFYIVLITLLIYSLIGTIAFIITDEDEDVAFVFGVGIVGLILMGISRITYKIINKLKHHIGKRSIFEEESTGNKYKCQVKDAEDIRCWVEGYKMLKRYAVKSEWVNIPDFSKEFIEKSKINCDYCRHGEKCAYLEPYVKCKHDDYGRVLEFDKFEKK